MHSEKRDDNWGGIQFCERLPSTFAGPSVDFLATGWQGQIERGTTIETVTQELDAIELTVLPIRLQSKLPQTIGFTFPESPEFNAPATQLKDSSRAGSDAEPGKSIAEKKASGGSPSKSTRIKPPRDLVKLEDRLYFVLQPPLETLVATARLDFPFQPFPYQFEGIAFLFPREAAILADEMGLGKTMQAITTVRMLLLSSQLRNVLLICPKPLVTNWVREFRQWAPEIPVVVIEGDQAKRQYIWNQQDTPFVLQTTNC